MYDKIEDNKIIHKIEDFFEKTSDTMIIRQIQLEYNWKGNYAHPKSIRI